MNANLEKLKECGAVLSPDECAWVYSEIEHLYEAMRHADFWRPGYETGFGTTASTCRGCGCYWWPKIPELGGPTKHKDTCPFRFWLDAEGRVVIPSA